MKQIVATVLAGSALTMTSAAWADSDIEAGGGAERSARTTSWPDARRGSGSDRVLSTAGGDVAREFVIWSDDRLQGFIKPIIQVSSSVVGYVPESDRENQEYAERISTLLLSRIGFEGELFGFVSFRTLFERNVGFSLARNGPVGTSIWEGTASLQARENYIRLSKWGLQLTAGILPDPASVDFISDNILDTFGMDPYVRDPLLVSGFNQGQSVLLRAKLGELSGLSLLDGLTAGVSFTGGNPLVSSLSFGFGGQVAATGTLFTAPLRALSNGIPGSNLHMSVVTPSLTYDNRFFGIRTAGQFYWVDNDVTQAEDAELTGFNLRATAKVNVWPEVVTLYGTAAYRENDTVVLPDITTLSEERFEGIVASGGFDIAFDRMGLPGLGFGGNYYYLDQQFTAESVDGRPDDLTLHYINVGLTYWLWEDAVSAGFRWARSMAEATQSTREPALDATDSFILSLRLLI